MAAADYRLMTEATGQRIATALEALSGTGAAAAAARTNLDVYSKGETDNAIAQSTAYSSEYTQNSNGLDLRYRKMGNLCFGTIIGAPTDTTQVSFIVPKAIEGFYITCRQWGNASTDMQAWIDRNDTTLRVRNYVANNTVRISFSYLCE